MLDSWETIAEIWTDNPLQLIQGQDRLFQLCYALCKTSIFFSGGSNTRTVFKTVNQLLNPAANCELLSQESPEKCEEFATFSYNGVSSVRAQIVANPHNYDGQLKEKGAALSKFIMISEPELCKIVSESKSTICVTLPWSRQHTF